MKTIQATMAGTVLQVLVGEGDLVEPGQDVAVLESMKMEVPVQADHGGKVSAVKAEVGSFVNDGDTLVELDG
ncbi:MAG: biotin/lipoyl-binding protein [Firmicutes bacterium]|uniref:Acetyl-CoA carboxylase biotin carboxyl carrier protein n=1 Tax=Melghirimyces thermohalophilus TaxID=1236220 RepID=A0A1G6HQJ4_9BACL|nr:biotin/lipoyl-containing protein [Melghirimyces thermohalophilus]MDA8351734.1 biotin/lipoyl-binding protein [Bacillota bacterium]SDB96464.1 acetyl-CoA carboxylase biotin carboxyl carrier protein [Melghirimyces thermohalophilus]